MHHAQPHPPQPIQPQPIRSRARHTGSAPHLLDFPQSEAVTQGIATCSGSQPELAHDARNLIAALDLYCELLAVPGVLAPGFAGYADDLRRVTGNGARLIEALAAAGGGMAARRNFRFPRETDCPPLARRPFPAIEDLAAEVEALEGPLQALAGPGVRLEVESRPCSGRLALNPEELLRILFNLVANAVEAMAATSAELRRSPFLRITAQRGGAVSFLERAASSHPGPLESETVVISVRDNGPGIPPSHLFRIFDAGFSTRSKDDDEAPRGLGLAIVRRLVAQAGGAVRAVSPAGFGARFDIELPILQSEETGPGEAKPPQLELAASPPIARIPALKQISAQIEKEA